MLPEPAEVSMLQGGNLPVKILTRLIEFSSLGVTFACGMGAWQLQGELGRVIAIPPEKDGEEIDVPCWTHEDIQINFPCPPTS